MSRNGSGVYSLPAGSTVSNGDVSDASDLNTPLSDLEADANVARPIVAGGTGASSASGARTALGLAIGTDVQAYDADLASWAGVTRASGFDTFAATPSSANLRSLLTDETGTGAALFAGGNMGTPSAVVLTNATGLPFAGIDAAAVVTAAEAISANNNDTTIPTSAAVYNVSGRVLLAFKTASASATLDFTEFNNAIYRYYVCELEDVLPSVDGEPLFIRFSTNGGASYDNGPANYDHVAVGGSVAGTASVEASGGNTAIRLTFASGVGNAAGEKGVTGEVKIYHAGDAAKRARVMFSLSYETTAGNIFDARGSGRRLTEQDTDAIRFLFASGNIASGVIRLYGVLQ